MISPEVYIDEKKKWSLQKLYKERDELIQAIKMYEEGKLEERDVYMLPSPETIYKYNKEEYLPRLEILIAKKEQNNFLRLKIDDYTDFYLKIIRKKDFEHDPYDRWCDVIISISNKYFNYNNKGELLLEFEVVELRNLLQKFINDKLKKDESISFIEPDLEFYTYTNNLVDLRINLFEDGALSPNYYNLCFDKEEIKKIYNYIIQIFPEKEDNKKKDAKSDIEGKDYGIPDSLQEQYYYLTVEYDEYNNGKTYCYMSEDTNIKIGDKVVVYMADNIVIATVVDAQYYTRENAPYPVEKTKRVIEKITETTDLSKYDIYYDDIDEYDEDDYVSTEELVKKEKEINKLHKIILDMNIDVLSIKRLMKLLPMKNTQELYITMYYSKNMSMFINKVATDFYMLPEYDANLFNKKEYKAIIEKSIVVPRKLYDNKDNEDEIYKDAIQFCKENDIKYMDDYKNS